MFARIFMLVAVSLVTMTMAVSIATATQAEMFDGRILTVSADKHLTIQQPDDQRTFVVNDRTAITLDGEAARWEDLKPGFTAMIQAERDGDHFVARAIAVFNDQ